jgi:mono/diheme cytochrome c family protein
VDRRGFDHNCAHCHGDDARGDEGPDLHGLTKSDKRLEKIINGGIKGEMPAFGKNSATRRCRRSSRFCGH